MFRTTKHILAAGVAVAVAAVPSIALADPPASSGSVPTASQITVIKTVDAPSPKLVQASVAGRNIAPAK